MYVRKLVKSGLSSYTVALPKDWVMSNKLKRGDLVYIREKSNDEIIISTSVLSKAEEKEDKTIVINIDGKTKGSIIREIRYAYLNNYKEIIVKGKDLNKSMRCIKNQISELVALEVIEESSERIISRSFLNEDEVAPWKAIRRIDNIVRSMFTDTQVTVEKEDLSEMITERDLEVNRLVFLVFKIVISGLKNPRIKQIIGLPPTSLMQCWNVSFHIEKIGDELKRTARIIAEMNQKKEKFDKKALVQLFQEIHTFYTDIMTGLYKKNFAVADEGKDRQIQLSKKCDEYFLKNRSINVSEVSGKFKAIVSHVDDISKLTHYLAE